MSSIVSFAAKAAALQHSQWAAEINVPMDEIYFSFLLNAAVYVFFPSVTDLTGSSDVHL